MAEQQMPPNDHFVTSFQFTKTLHRDDYPAIDPTLPQHSQAGKVAMITGATRGIGRGNAIAFTKAGAAGLALFSRDAAKLEETKQLCLEINPKIKIVTVAGDVTVQADVDRLKDAVEKEFEYAHVVVNVAGAWDGRGSIRDNPVEKWWRDIEINNKGTYMVTQAFLRLLGTERKGHCIQVGTFGCQLVIPNCSSYSLSKSWLNRFTEYVAAENPNVTAICYNPGSVATAILDVHPDFAYFSQDALELGCNVCVYLCTPRAEYLNGRYMAASWDIDELEAKKDEILEGDLLKFTLRGKIGPQYYKDEETAKKE